jgi:Gas vesicle synthesis protein GvpO
MATARKSSTSGGSRPSGATKRTSAKKAPAKRTATKKSAAKKSAATRSSSRQSDQQSRPAPKKAKSSAMKVARAAAEQLTELTGRRPEVVVGVERNDDGWQVELEVVESRRIPDSTDILATYRVQVDENGEMLGYYRAQRYVRGKGGERG